jgi:Family of unknown function (DUF5678)
MNEIETFPAPIVDFNVPATSNEPYKPHPKWQREYEAFQKMLPELLQHYRDKYVAIHEGKVVDFGNDQIEVAMRAYKTFGYVPIYVGLVTDQPIPPVRIPSPRLVENIPR